MESVEDTISAYEQWVRSWSNSEATVRHRVGVVRGRLLEWDGLAGVTTANIEAWLGRAVTASGRRPSAWTRSSYATAMKTFCEWAVASGRLTENPALALRPGKQPKSQPKPLSDGDMARVLLAATGRQRDWILLALHAGLRAHEIAKIRGEDVQEDGLYVDGKGGVRAILPTHPTIWEVAQRYPRNGPWFPSRQRPGEPISAGTVSAQIGALFRSLGITGGVHRVRHTYGTRLLRAGVNVRTVQKLMRHANLDTTAMYTAVDEDELRAAILRLPSA